MVAPRFIVRAKGGQPESTRGVFTLIVDLWDDYHFKTTFSLHYGTGESVIEIGAVKVATFGMVEGDPHIELPHHFQGLGDDYFSLGQDREYYEALTKLPKKVGRTALAALRDVAANEELLEGVREEPVFSTSLLRSVPINTVTTQFRRIIEGRPILTPYEFAYSLPEGRGPAMSLNFEVAPGAMPPTNLHVLIGANGVGKSHLLRDFALAASQSEHSIGTIADEARRLGLDSGVPFANVVHVAFSAFDREGDFGEQNHSRIELHRVGLSDGGSESLSDQFDESVRLCLRGPRRGRWMKAYTTLAGADGILNESRLDELVDPLNELFNAQAAVHVFSRMSSGHKIVVLTITRLVELVEERSLVLLDEPETHLHPPLLSALMRSISDLVIDRNGVALVATHSPVVLQEVPRSCVWRLQRSGDDIRAARLPNETFGESVSRLTTDVFHLDVNRTGYNAILRDLLSERSGSVSLVLEALDDQLGSEGQFVLSALGYSGDDLDV